MSKGLSFTETDILNATWSGIKSLQGKSKKDATDANAISKGTSAITKYLELKSKWAQFCSKNPDAKNIEMPLLSDTP